MNVIHDKLRLPTSTRSGNQLLLVVLIAVVFAASVILTASGRSRPRCERMGEPVIRIFARYS